ncbi:GGDEF domain-containing protein [Thauera sp.]|uniref:GGDEF domain-containing protein n=1 Tax=Thauera sp. TaxID=1905334 RepID=UPI002A370F6A|nr:GGDEF domain-containing protein [Thauera sp.]MDX9884863.1 GGDEF domain-containing protein [Thauera sp.]
MNSNTSYTDPHQLSSDQITHAYERAGESFVLAALMGGALAACLATEVPLLPVLGWFAFHLLANAGHALLGRRLHARGDQHRHVGANLSQLMLVTGASGLSWGASVAFLPFLSAPAQQLVIVVPTAIGVASMTRLAALPSVQSAYTAAVFLPLLIGLVVVFGSAYWALISAIALIWVALTLEARRAHQRVVALYTAQQSLEDKAVRDKLTGVPNRRAFDVAMEREWGRASRLKVPLSVIMIDIDFFKKYNDRYGHQAGDTCLAAVAKALSTACRRQTDLLARYGGEEFVALLFHTPRDDATRIGETLRRAVEQLQLEHAANTTGVVTISLGGATCIPTSAMSALALLESADAALYRAKEQGRNRVEWAQI